MSDQTGDTECVKAIPVMKQNEQSRYKTFTRRAAILGGGQALLLSALAGRLYYLQTVESERYKLLAEENRINLRLIPPQRGNIVDRNGRPLAVNQKNYRVLFMAEQVPDTKSTLEKLSVVMPLSEREMRRALREIRQKPKFVPITIRENLDWEEVAKIEVNALDLPGISIDVGLRRYYPFGPEAAHVVGYVGAVSEDDLTDDPVLQLPGFRIGKNGLERTFEKELRGTAGTSHVEVNAFGRVIQETERHEGIRGAVVRSTIDIELQRYTLDRVNGESAGVVVMDAFNGEVYALVSAPSYDPNMFTRGLTNVEWQGLIGDPMTPLVNKATAGAYHPGSVFKIATALAAMEHGVDPTRRYRCSGHLDLGQDRFHCWKRGGHGWMDLASSLIESCDVYFYEVSQLIGIDNIAATAKKLGLGVRLDIDLPNQTEGVVPTRDWKLGNLGYRWKRGETLVCSIGQGFVLTTPLQNAVMQARVINGGYAVTPRLMRTISGEGGLQLHQEKPPFEKLDFDPVHLEFLKRGTDGVTNTQRGTAHAARILEPEMSMGGKTGTAQVRRITLEERLRGVRKNEDLPWEERDHALFVGYAPVETPRYVISVVVEHGGGGSSVAAPIARDVMIEVLRRDPAGIKGGRNLAEKSATDGPNGIGRQVGAVTVSGDAAVTGAQEGRR